MFIYYDEELLAPRPTPKLEDHPLSFVGGCLFNVFAATFHSWRPFLHPQPEDTPCSGDRDPPNMVRDLYTSPSIIIMMKLRGMKWAGHVAGMGEKKDCRLSLGKLHGNRPLGRRMQRWVDNIKMGLGEVRWCGVDWIGLAQDRDKWKALVNAVMNLQVA
jgi:hypothetical protein